MMQRLKGLGVSPGVAIGRAIVLKQRARDLRLRLPGGAVARELDRLAAARERSRAQLQDIKVRVARLAGAEHAYLFDAQLLMLDDPLLMGRAEELVCAERLNAEWAVRRAFEELAAILDQAEDAYLRERKGDVGDLVGRLRLNLRGSQGARALLKDVEEPCVLVADELPPSLAAQVDWRRVLGFATDAGSWTYHTAILARSLGVPGIVGLGDLTARIQPGATLAMDGSSGELVIDPDPTVLSKFEQRRSRLVAAESPAEQAGPTLTADGVRVRLDANIELPDEVADARAAAAEGIGLYRSEFLLRGQRAEALAEDAQYEVYRRLLEDMAPAPVTVRTFDVGEAQLRGEAELAGPQARPLGLRALWLNLSWRDVFRAQVRALLRAAPYGRLRIIFPFVSSLDEFREARQLVDEAAATLRSAGVAAPAVPLGAMIEVPAAALTADLLAREADFFSVGTNDLIQYALAIERTDARLAPMYDPLHPAILRLVRQVLRAGRRHARPVSVCGEMAADAALIALLVGLGATELSMAPSAIPAARRVIAALRADEARRLAARALRAVDRDTLRRDLGALVAAPGRSQAVNQ